MLILSFILSRFLIYMKALCGVPASNAKWGEVAGIVTECKLKRYQEKTKSSIKVPNYYLSGYILNVEFLEVPLRLFFRLFAEHLVGIEFVDLAELSLQRLLINQFGVADDQHLHWFALHVLLIEVDDILKLDLLNLTNL